MDNSVQPHWKFPFHNEHDKEWNVENLVEVVDGWFIIRLFRAMAMIYLRQGQVT
jgi:hypothetical protein